MAYHHTPEPVKTYISRENAIKAVEKAYGLNDEHFGSSKVRYVIMQHTDGRYYPLFFGNGAIENDVFRKFNCVN